MALRGGARATVVIGIGAVATGSFAPTMAPPVLSHRPSKLVWIQATRRCLHKGMGLGRPIAKNTARGARKNTTPSSAVFLGSGRWVMAFRRSAFRGSTSICLCCPG